MKKDEIKIGEVYIAKISNVLSPVRILSVGNFNANGFNGLNLRTNKKVFIRSAQKLRYTQAEYNALREKVKAARAAHTSPAQNLPAQLELVTCENKTWAHRVHAHYQGLDCINPVKFSAPAPHASQV